MIAERPSIAFQRKNLDNQENFPSFKQLSENQSRNLLRQQGFKILDLNQYLVRYGGHLNESHARILLIQIIQHILYMNSQGLNFVDIDPEKILITMKHKNDISQHEVIITNQVQKWRNNSSKKSQAKLSKFWSRNAAPEVFISSYCSKQEIDASYIDVWNIGVLLYYILTGVEPFIDAYQVMKGQYQMPTNQNLSVDCLDVISRTLFAYPVIARTKLNQLQLLPWFQNFTFNIPKNNSDMQTRYKYLQQNNCNNLFNLISGDSSQLTSLGSIFESEERSVNSLKDSFEKFSGSIEKILQSLQTENKQCSGKSFQIQLKNEIFEQSGSSRSCGIACD